MYAIIKSGGKQYRVSVGESLKVETIAADVGAQVVLGEVLAVSDDSGLKVGTPLVAGASCRNGPFSRPCRQGSNFQVPSS